MAQRRLITEGLTHRHVYLADDHERSEKKTWAVISLCAVMMVAEIAGGLIFGSIALIADGLHMSTHAGALLLAALAYTYARKHAEDTDYTFGTGKLGDLAGFTSAVILAMIGVLIGYESVVRMLAPIQIHFAEAIPIACVGLAVNIASAWLLSSGAHHHSHGHTHVHGDEPRRIHTTTGELILEIFETDAPPRFRLRRADGSAMAAASIQATTERSNGSRQKFSMVTQDGFLESTEDIPEPHEFMAQLVYEGATYFVSFEEHVHEHTATGRDNNIRAAIVHVIADAAVSVLVIVGLLLARSFGWLWMDPVAGIIGACVIASWSYGLIRDTGAVLLDRIPDKKLFREVRHAIESDGTALSDLHLWRLGPGHLGAIVSVCPSEERDAGYYRSRLAQFASLSHLTIEIQNR
jgi:cation diffusion facilitator family transporter